jgi:hypothetical protein
MADIARLGILVDSRQVTTANKELDGLTRSSTNAEAAVSRFEKQTVQAGRSAGTLRTGLTGARSELQMLLPYLTRMTAALAAPFAVASIVNTTREFEKLRATLKTLEGGAREGAEAFDDIRSFAAETPYDVRQVTEAYIRLKAMGLDPTTDSLRSYGNTASAMGKNILQLVEAVADASTGENERLKEFGIRARDLGNEVAFTFQGVTTKVKKNSEDIQEYLLNIGNTNFAGAMDDQMNTLNGAFSNFGDTLEGFQDAVGTGFSSALTEATKGMSEFLQELVDSGEAAQFGRDIGTVIRDVGGAISYTVGVIREGIGYLEQFTGWLDDAGKRLGEWTGLNQVGPAVIGPMSANERVSTAFDKTSESPLSQVPTSKPKGMPDPNNKGGGGDTEKLNEYQRMTERIAERTAALQAENEATGMTTFAAERLQATRDLERAAIEAGLELTPLMTEQINATATAYSEAQLQAEGLRLELEQRGVFEIMEQDLANLSEMLNRGAIDWNTYAQAVIKTKAQAHVAIAGMAKDAVGLMGQLFENNKAVAIADAIVSTYQGVAKSLAQYPMPFAAVMAAAHLALGMKQVMAIRSTNKNSKSASGGGVGGGAAVAPPLPSNEAGGKTIAVELHGDNFSKSSVEEMFEEFNEHIADGGRIAVVK